MRKSHYSSLNSCDVPPVAPPCENNGGYCAAPPPPGGAPLFRFSYGPPWESGPADPYGRPWTGPHTRISRGQYRNNGAGQMRKNLGGGAESEGPLPQPRTMLERNERRGHGKYGLQKRRYDTDAELNRTVAASAFTPPVNEHAPRNADQDWTCGNPTKNYNGDGPAWSRKPPYPHNLWNQIKGSKDQTTEISNTPAAPTSQNNASSKHRVRTASEAQKAMQRDRELELKLQLVRDETEAQLARTAAANNNNQNPSFCGIDLLNQTTEKERSYPLLVAQNGILYRLVSVQGGLMYVSLGVLPHQTQFTHRKELNATVPAQIAIEHQFMGAPTRSLQVNNFLQQDGLFPKPNNISIPQLAAAHAFQAAQLNQDDQRTLAYLAQAQQGQLDGNLTTGVRPDPSLLTPFFYNQLPNVDSFSLLKNGRRLS